MREIKFRAWDTKALRMSDEFNLFGEFTMLGGVHDWQEESGLPGSSLGRLNDLEVMEFTGLKDKNGKEIYEGDIIKIMSRGLLFICRVHWPVELEPIDEFGKQYEHMLYSPLWPECEVIGNIYESSNEIH